MSTEMQGRVVWMCRARSFKDQGENETGHGLFSYRLMKGMEGSAEQIRSWRKERREGKAARKRRDYVSGPDWQDRDTFKHSWLLYKSRP